jgi:hypothetical protein
MTPTDVDLEQEARPTGRHRFAPTRTKAVLGWAGAAAVLTAGAVLAAVTFTAGGKPTTVETPVGRSGSPAPACTWSPDADGPVFPAHDLGPAPTPESVLVFEMCAGESTGDLAWLGPGLGRPTTHGGDDGLPNPFEAGNEAVARYFDESGRP